MKVGELQKDNSIIYSRSLRTFPHLSNNVLVKILGYLRNKEILKLKLVSRKLFGLLTDPFAFNLCIDLESPRKAMEDFRLYFLHSREKGRVTTEGSESAIREQIKKCVSFVNVSTLNLSNLGLKSEREMAAVFTVLRECENFVERIDLVGNMLSSSVLSPLLEFLQGDTCLAELNLKNTKLNGTDIESLCVALILNRGVVCLNLSDNVIGSKVACRAISDMLKHNRTLERLYLKKTYIGNDGALAILEAAQSSLKRLYLEGNKISSRTIKAIHTKTRVYI